MRYDGIIMPLNIRDRILQRMEYTRLPVEIGSIIRCHCDIDMLQPVGGIRSIDPPDTHWSLQCELTTFLAVFVGVRFTCLYEDINAFPDPLSRIDRQRQMDIMLWCRLAAFAGTVPGLHCFTMQ